MIYDVRHITRYRYAAPVAHATCLLRMTPLADTSQDLHSHSIDIVPGPSMLSRERCFFGTTVTRVLIEQPHTSLTVTAQARIGIDRPVAGSLFPSPTWESVRLEAQTATGLDRLAPAHFLFPSRLVPRAPSAADYARESFSPGRPVLDAALELMARIKTDFRYAPEATAIATPIEDVMRERHGVCQDFAHLMIAGLRGLGLPAAYVSGYLRTRPPEGKPRLAGADASHAWVQLWCGAGLGWVGLDPTNGIRVGNDHIIIGFGRDYADVAPIDGVIIAAGEHSHTVEVDVIPVSLQA